MRDPIAGGSVFWLNDTVDGGPIARHGWCWIHQDDNASELWRRELFPMGLRLIRETLDEIMSGTLRMVVRITESQPGNRLLIVHPGCSDRSWRRLVAVTIWLLSNRMM